MHNIASTGHTHVSQQKYNNPLISLAFNRAKRAPNNIDVYNHVL